MSYSINPLQHPTDWCHKELINQNANKILEILRHLFQKSFAIENIQPRLQSALSQRDVNRAGDPKSEEEKEYFLSAIVKFSKKREKISPGAEVGEYLIHLLTFIRR